LTFFFHPFFLYVFFVIHLPSTSTGCSCPELSPFFVLFFGLDGVKFFWFGWRCFFLQCLSWACSIRAFTTSALETDHFVTTSVTPPLTKVKATPLSFSLHPRHSSRLFAFFFFSCVLGPLFLFSLYKYPKPPPMEPELQPAVPMQAYPSHSAG